jgi:hypothetical protein
LKPRLHLKEPIETPIADARAARGAAGARAGGADGHLRGARGRRAPHPSQGQRLPGAPLREIPLLALRRGCTHYTNSMSRLSHYPSTRGAWTASSASITRATASRCASARNSSASTEERLHTLHELYVTTLSLSGSSPPPEGERRRSIPAPLDWRKLQRNSSVRHC